MNETKNKSHLGGAVLTLHVAASDADRVGDLLVAQWGRPVAENRAPDGKRATLEVYFGNSVEAELAARTLCVERAYDASVRIFAAEDWAESWKRHFHAMEIGERLRVVPPWLANEPSGRVDVVINPGLSFGTGQHFTTRFCLEQLDRLLPALSAATVLDVGTGSGILAIAAVRLGARHADGVDSDPACIGQARKNAARNEAADRTSFSVHNLTTGWSGGRYDLVCANLYSGLLIDLAPVLLPIARVSLLLSGIGTKEVDAVAAAFRRAGGRETFRDQDHEWAGLVVSPCD